MQTIWHLGPLMWHQDAQGMALGGDRHPLKLSVLPIDNRGWIVPSVVICCEERGIVLPRLSVEFRNLPPDAQPEPGVDYVYEAFRSELAAESSLPSSACFTGAGPSTVQFVSPLPDLDWA